MTHTILVTGGIGTLGRAVVETALLAGHNVRVFSRRQATSPELPLRRPPSVSRCAMDHHVRAGHGGRDALAAERVSGQPGQAAQICGTLRVTWSDCARMGCRLWCHPW